MLSDFTIKDWQIPHQLTAIIQIVNYHDIESTYIGWLEGMWFNLLAFIW